MCADAGRHFSGKRYGDAFPVSRCGRRNPVLWKYCGDNARLQYGKRYVVYGGGNEHNL